MSQIGLKKLKKSWVAFSTITQPVSDTLYYIQNRGADYLVACEAISEPTTQEGIFVPPKKILKYKVGNQNLYLRSTGSCTINVSDEG